MNVVPLLVLFSLVLATLSVLLFVWSARNRDVDHADRLSLLPLEDDVQAPSPVQKNVPDQVIE
jgi:cbb3-type cytochrome oxidase maturation protein